MSDVQTLVKIVSPLVTGLGYEFWGCELVGAARSRRMVVYIDSPKGVDVEDCATVSRQISAVLDIEDPISGEYTLEVSSPGMDRPLFYIEQFERYIGENIKLRLKVPLLGRKNFSGRLISVEGERISILVNDKDIILECSNISSANVDPFS